MSRPLQDISIMKTASLLPLSLLWSLLKVHPQTAPYVSFRGEILLNHSYVDLSLVGDPETSISSGDAVQCHTDIQECCSPAEGGIRNGWWYLPDGMNVPFSSDDTADIHIQRVAQRVELRRRDDALSPSGIYRCEIMVNGDDNIRERERVYVGIYGSGGDIIIPDGATFALISDDEFTLTCISTGGPATTVTWTRDSVTVTEGTETVLDNTVTAQYTHTLTGSTGGEYTCIVANSLSSATATFTVEGTAPPTNVRAERASTTSIRVSWTPSSDATGYRIDYTSNGGSSVSVTVSGGTTNERLLAGLLNGAIYTTSIVATSTTSFPSESVEADMTVSLVPDQPSINTNPPTTPTSISLSWNVPDSVVTSSVVSWQRDISGECPDDEDEGSTITGSSTSTTITGREEDSRYFITVTAFNDAGSGQVSNIVTAVTEEAAPSAAPTDVSATSTSTTITVQWGPVECIHRNGVITGYSVQYVIQGQSRQTLPAPGDSSGGTYEIIGLQSSTTYSIQVAAITGVAHVGDYSSTITEFTSGGVSLSVDSTSTTSLTISWILDEGVTATSYTISYENTDTDCFSITDSEDITTSEMSHELTGLEEGTEYSITVTTILIGGETVSDTETGTTIPVVPSAPPDPVRLSVVTSTAITVQWEMVPCVHRNGDITGYLVQYIGGGATDSKSVTGDDATMTTFEGLMPSTTYSIVIAAVNDAGTGDYSNSMIIETPQSVFLKLRSDIIPNHGYLVISHIGSSMTDVDSLLCITDGVANADGSEGNWFAPDGTRVSFTDVPGVKRNRGDMVVRLFRSTADPHTPSEGIYHCMVQDATPVFQTVYVGLYNSGGGIVDVQSVTFSLDNETSPQFTLTCISTGGPATTVTWTRDSQTAVEERRCEVVNGVTAQYTHTLTVTGRLGGLYTCTVSNEVSSGDSESLTVIVASAPTNVKTVQESLTSIRVFWTPSILGDTTGYIISYTGGSSDSVTVSDPNIDNYLLTGLVMDSNYTISIVATSEHLPSDVLEVDITLVSLPGQPSVSVTSITATSISLSWSVPSDSVVTSYAVMWRETDSGATEMTSGSLTDTSYTIEQLDSTTIYTITVTAANQAGNTDSLPITIPTASDVCEIDSMIDSCDCTSADDTAAIIGGVVAIIFIFALITIVVLVLRSRQGHHNNKRELVIQSSTNIATLELPKFSEEPAYIDPDVIRISSNEAYHTVSQTGGTTTDYETISDPHTVPPSTSHSSQPPTAGDYEQV